MRIKMFISLEGVLDDDGDVEREEKEGSGKQQQEGGDVGKAVDGSVAAGAPGGTGGAPGSRAPTPPAPTSVPVRTPFTAEDTLTLGSASAERKDDDLSLIVHVDDTLDNDTLDNDILGTPMRNATNDADIKMDADDNNDENSGAGAKAGDGATGDQAQAPGVVDDGDNKENTATPAPSAVGSAVTDATGADDQKKDANDADTSKTDAAKKEASSDSKTKRLVCIKVMPKRTSRGAVKGIHYSKCCHLWTGKI